MSKKSIKKITMTVGVGLLTAIMSPSVINQQVVLDSSVEAASAKITYTDAQQVTYSLDTVAKTAEVTSFSGSAGADIIIPDVVVSNGQTYAVTSIGTYAFSNTGIHSVIIGNNVVDINTSAFQTTAAYSDYYKNALTEVVLGQSVQNIKTDAFAGNALTSIIFPNSVIKIATRAFANNNLTELSFGPNVTEIMPKAFQSNQISSITFDADSLTTVDSTAFSGSPVCFLTLGNGVSLADDAFNKVSPLFGQLTDLPTSGIRTIIVDSNGILEKSWTNTESSNSTNNNSNNLGTDAAILDEVTDQLDLSDASDNSSSNDSTTTLPNRDEKLEPNSESDSSSLGSNSNENPTNGLDSDLSTDSVSNEQNDSSLDSTSSVPTTSNTENSTLPSSEETDNPDNNSDLNPAENEGTILNQEANNGSLASSTSVDPSNSGNDSSAQANENTSPILSSPDIVDNASNSSGSDVSASTNLNPKTETPPTTPPEIIKGPETEPKTSNTESSTSNSPSSEVTDKSASNSSSDLSTNQEKDLKTEENAPSITVETSNEKSSQRGSTTESSKPDSALTNSSDGSSSPESLTDKKTNSSSEIKTDQSAPTFESEGSPTTNTSVINKITESRKDTEETIASAQSKFDSNKSTTVNSAKELDKNQPVDENPLKDSSPDKSAGSGKQLPVAPANNQESNDKAASPQNILQILPNLSEKNTINKVEPEDSNSHLTEQNPAQHLKEILPILKNSPIDSANIDQGIIKRILKSNKEVKKSQSQLSKNLPLALDSDKISNVKLIAKDKQNQIEDESWKTSPDFDRIAVEKSEMALTTPDSSTQNSGISSKSDSDNLNQEGQFNIENRDKLFSEREEAGAIISDNHKLDHTDVLSKNNSKIKLFISLLIIIIGSAIGWFIIFFKKRKKDNN